jgi:curli biogenesis system outer membrane secretion channel CsgG
MRRNNMRKINAILLAFLLLLAAACAKNAAWAAEGRGEAAGKIMVGVMPFESKTSKISRGQLDLITDVFTHELVQSKTLSVFDRTQLVQKIGNEKFEQKTLSEVSGAVEAGKTLGLRYILQGVLTQINLNAVDTFFTFTAKNLGEVALDMRIIDVNASQVAMTVRTKGFSSDAVWDLPDYENVIAGFGKTEGTAVMNAVSSLANEVRVAIGGETHHVIGVAAKEITIDVASAGEGMLYLVYTNPKEIKDLQGKVIGVEKSPVAVIKVREVNRGFSVAEVVANGGNASLIRRGDSIEPISANDVQKLTRGKKFIKERPKASSDTFKNLMKN